MKVNSFTGSLVYWIVKFLGVLIRALPVSFAHALGRRIGNIGYYLDIKHKSLAYANLKIAFAKTKKPSEIKRIVKELFRHFGMNVVDFLRLPLIRKQGVENFITLKGREHVEQGLKKGKGVILLAMHFGSWEISSLMGDLLDHPYRVIVNPQKRFNRLDQLLNSYRGCGGSTIITRGSGTREVIESLRRNEVIGMVVDQGGKRGSLIKFFGREASMSVGAIRLGMKMGTPVCFSIIIRKPDGKHELIIHPPLELRNTGETESDLQYNLEPVMQMMEHYIRLYPYGYIWFYKIWKYSKETAAVIIHDGKTGHIRQSQAVALQLEKALLERGIHCATEVIEIHFKNRLAKCILAFLSLISNANFLQGRMRYFKWFLNKESFRKISSIKADYVISCGSAAAYVNYILSSDCRAKAISVLTPGILPMRKFRLIILPQHDRHMVLKRKADVLITRVAINLVSEDYLKSQTHSLLKKCSQLKTEEKYIGVFIGGKSKRNYLTLEQTAITIEQLRQAATRYHVKILCTTSRRTPPLIASLMEKEFRHDSLCALLICANKENIPEAVGGILGLSDIVVVSGDSISMISESVSAGKKTIVLLPEERKTVFPVRNKHKEFIDRLFYQNHVWKTEEKHLLSSISEIMEGHLKVKGIRDDEKLLQAMKRVI